jgi:hypothetical protein
MIAVSESMCLHIPNLILKGFDYCVLHLKESCFLDFVHHLMFLKNTTFRKQDLFQSSGIIIAAPTGPVIEASLSKGPNSLRATILLPDDGNSSSFRNVMLFKNYYTMDKVQKHYSFKHT